MKVKTKVESMLINYKSNKTKIKLAEISIEGLNEQLNRASNKVIESDKECIEGMSLKSKNITDMPIAQSSEFRSVTEDVALSYKSDKNWTPQKKQKIAEMINNIEYSINDIKIDTQKVDLLLKLLDKKSKYVIEQYYIENVNWNKLCNQFELNFGFHDIDTLQRYRNKAILLMESSLI